MAIPELMDMTWLNPGSVSLNAQELRRADATMFNGDGTTFGVLGGIVRHGDLSLDVTVNASDLVTVQPGAVVIPGNSGVGNGCYRTALAVATTGTLSARNATNPRITLVVYRAMDTDVVGTHGAYTGRIEFIDGTPAASPVAPALPALAVELARITVPATGGGTATVDKSFRTYAVALGGVLPVATAARLPAVDTKWDRAIAVDTGQEYIWDGTSWQPLNTWVDDFASATSYVGTLTATASGTVLPSTSTYNIVVPAGRTLEVDFRAPIGVINATTGIQARILAGATVLDALYLSNSNAAALGIPVSLRGTIVGTGVSIAMKVEAWKVGTGAASVESQGLAPTRIRHMIR